MTAYIDIFTAAYGETLGSTPSPAVVLTAEGDYCISVNFLMSEAAEARNLSPKLENFETMKQIVLKHCPINFGFLTLEIVFVPLAFCRPATQSVYVSSLGDPKWQVKFALVTDSPLPMV